MTITTDIAKAFAWIEQHPVVVTAILGLIGCIARRIFRATHRIDPTFWTLGRKFRVTAVHKYLRSDHPSGYDQTQHSDSDQWQALITIKSNLCNLRHTVLPANKEDVMAVVISRNGKENEKIIYFNK